MASDIGARQFTGKIGTGERFGLLHIEKGDLVRLPVQDAPLPERLQRLVGVDQRNAERVGELRLRHGDFKRVFPRSEEHTSELQSLMRISYAVFCLKKKKQLQIIC